MSVQSIVTTPIEIAIRRIDAKRHLLIPERDEIEPDEEKVSRIHADQVPPLNVAIEVRSVSRLDDEHRESVTTDRVPKQP